MHYTINPELLAQALSLSSSHDANHVIEQGLQLLIQQKQQDKILQPARQTALGRRFRRNARSRPA